MSDPTSQPPDPGNGPHREASAQATRETLARFLDPERLASVDSTNRYLVERAREGAPEGSGVLADRQTAGKGRLGRRWLDAEGSSVLCSVLFRPVFGPEEWHLLSWLVMLAGKDACLDVAGVEPACKWPNDLIIAGRKVAGLLAEVVVVPGSAAAPAVVVGIGINCNWPSDWPPKDDPDAGDVVRTAVSLDRAAGRPVDRDEVARSLLGRVSERYGALVLGGASAMAAVRTEYHKTCATIGELVRVDLVGESFAGTALDVDDRGCLLVDVGACIRTVEAGDVVHLR